MGPREPLDQKIRILVADDHAIYRRGLQALLEAEPDTVIVGEAADGEEAVTKAQELLPDVIIMDIGMPKMSGLEATRKIADLGMPSRILVLTVHAEEEYLLPVLRAGAFGYVTKNSADADLVQAIRTVQRGEAFLYPSAIRMLLTAFVHRASREELGAYHELSEREREVLMLTAQGLTNRQIAERLSVSTKSVDTYRARLMEKLNLRKRSDLVRFVLKGRLLEPGGTS